MIRLDVSAWLNGDRPAMEGKVVAVHAFREGRLRLNHFGSLDDMVLGGVIGRLLAVQAPVAQAAEGAACSAEGCALPG